MDATWAQYLKVKSAEILLLLRIHSNQFSCFVLVVKGVLLYLNPLYPGLIRNVTLIGISICLVLYLVRNDRCIDQSVLSRADGVVLAGFYIVTCLVSLVNWLCPGILPEPRVATEATMITVYLSWMGLVHTILYSRTSYLRVRWYYEDFLRLGMCWNGVLCLNRTQEMKALESLSWYTVS
ncbi:uncharacterized protein BO96DRAFT_440200 [Aspergillus niger CBS 101883]|uniref:uncharacterized protein n=1 Tax=Aspergillus lacticoffeatus (strain CBS 101883) TaxID=1450533 RepID=UPI000D7F2D9C|nr:uncharacterized protein BO96DRAFT_440200 [Aspergillus niger CBS 101883]PYH50134.1 hypothetical protein BO96DRAFT_440200 [Aspergillus niger CBS 101883]